MATPLTDEEFTEFVHAAWPGLFRTAYLMLGEHQLAEDLVQTALAKTYASWRKVKDPAAAPAYARVVLANTAASWFRRRSWRRSPARSPPCDDRDVGDYGWTPDGHLVGKRYRQQDSEVESATPRPGPAPAPASRSVRG